MQVWDRVNSTERVCRKQVEEQKILFQIQQGFKFNRYRISPGKDEEY